MLKRLPWLVVAGSVTVILSLPATSPAKVTCHSRTTSYLAQGKYVSSNPALAPSLSWSGTLTIKLSSANHQFTRANNLSVKKTSRGTEYTYTVTNAKVHFGQGVETPAAAGDHVTVSGTLTQYSSGCPSTTPTIKIKSISVSK